MSNHPKTPFYAEALGVASYFLVFFAGLYVVDHPLDTLGVLGLIYLGSLAQGAVEWLGRFEASTRPHTLGPIPVRAELTRERRLSDFPKQLAQLKSLGITVTDMRKHGDSRCIWIELELVSPDAPGPWWWSTQGQYLTLEVALHRLIEFQRRPPYVP